MRSSVRPARRLPAGWSRGDEQVGARHGLDGHGGLLEVQPSYRTLGVVVLTCQVTRPVSATVSCWTGEASFSCKEVGMASQEDIALMAHLLRRAGFGASRMDIEAQAAQGYDATVEALLHPEAQPALDEDLMLRYEPVYNHSGAIQVNVQQWVYWMINNPRQLQEKMALFWSWR